MITHVKRVLNFMRNPMLAHILVVPSRALNTVIIGRMNKA